MIVGAARVEEKDRWAEHGGVDLLGGIKMELTTLTWGVNDWREGGTRVDHPRFRAPSPVDRFGDPQESEGCHGQHQDFFKKSSDSYRTCQC